MWLDPDTFDEYVNAWLASMGRALPSAQSLEGMVKRSVYVDGEIRAASSMPIDEAIPHLTERLESPEAESDFERLLARAIDKLRKTWGLSDDDAQVLVDAKDARNKIAHDLVSQVGMTPGSVHRFGDLLTEYLRRVDQAIAAYNLMAWWAQRHEEPDSMPITFFRRYPGELAAWVLDPLLEVLGDEEHEPIPS